MFFKTSKQISSTKKKIKKPSRRHSNKYITFQRL